MVYTTDNPVHASVSWQTPPTIPFQWVVQVLDAVQVHIQADGELPHVDRPLLRVFVPDEVATRVLHILRQFDAVEPQTGVPRPLLSDLAHPLSRPQAIARILVDFYGHSVVSELLAGQADTQSIVQNFPAHFRLSDTLEVRAARFVRQMFAAADAAWLASAASSLHNSQGAPDGGTARSIDLETADRNRVHHGITAPYVDGSAHYVSTPAAAPDEHNTAVALQVTNSHRFPSSWRDNLDALRSPEGPQPLSSSALPSSHLPRGSENARPSDSASSLATSAAYSALPSQRVTANSSDAAMSTAHAGERRESPERKAAVFVNVLDQLLRDLPDDYLWAHEAGREKFKRAVMVLAARICDLADAIPSREDVVEAPSPQEDE